MPSNSQIPKNAVGRAPPMRRAPRRRRRGPKTKGRPNGRRVIDVLPEQTFGDGSGSFVNHSLLGGNSATQTNDVSIIHAPWQPRRHSRQRMNLWGVPTPRPRPKTTWMPRVASRVNRRPPEALRQAMARHPRFPRWPALDAGPEHSRGARVPLRHRAPPRRKQQRPPMSCPRRRSSSSSQMTTQREASGMRPSVCGQSGEVCNGQPAVGNQQSAANRRREQAATIVGGH